MRGDPRFFKPLFLGRGTLFEDLEETPEFIWGGLWQQGATPKKTPGREDFFWGRFFFDFGARISVLIFLKGGPLFKTGEDPFLSWDFKGPHIVIFLERDRSEGERRRLGEPESQFGILNTEPVGPQLTGLIFLVGAIGGFLI